MRVVQLAPRVPFRWLAVSVAAAAASLAWRAHQRAAAPPPPPIACAVASVPAEPIDQLEAPAPHFAVPPPGDPYARPDLNPPDTTGIDAELITRDEHAPMCGTFMVSSIATFRPLEMDGKGDLRVVVQCAELLQPHGLYHLSLAPANDVPDGKNDVLWRATSISGLATVGDLR
jgi:hypothetical protein